jgi:hypothetical protein
MEFHLFIQLFFLLFHKPFKFSCPFRTKEKVIFAPLPNKTVSLPPVHEFPVVESKWDCGEVPF